MKISTQMLRQAESDLGLNTAFVKGADLPVKNCWHFCTDGNAVDSIFYDEQDFIQGMNRIYTVSRKFNIIILAHVLMDTHIHFVIYGTQETCGAFMHEYIRLTSMHLAHKHNFNGKLRSVPIRYIHIDNDLQLKTAICYVIKNPTVAGLKFTPYDYPWSSGSLYFRREGYWTSPCWQDRHYFCDRTTEMTARAKQTAFKTRTLDDSARVSSTKGLIFPGEYVEFKLVERLFRSFRSYQFFMGRNKEEGIDSLAANASRLSIPIQEMRQSRDEIIVERFGRNGIKDLSTVQRIMLAKMLRSKYSSSTKQIARVCGLVHEELKDII